MPADPIWAPSAERVAASQMHRFIERHRPGAADYSDLHRWSVADPAGFWRACADDCGLTLRREPDVIVEHPNRMPGARWFVGAKLSYAENLLAGDPRRIALVTANERGIAREISLAALRRAVAAVAAALRSFGVGPGDRVAGILPNAEHAVVAALATSSIGAIWASCSPDFGKASLLDRLRQIGPRVLFGVDGYRYAGRPIDCVPTLREVVAGLPSVARVVIVRHLDGAASVDPPFSADDWDDVVATEAEPQFMPVAFDDPLFIMFSSGTTGPPKCIVHGTGGTLLQHLKEHRLHTDIGPGDRVFYFTTTGWMMWNWLLSALGSGATLILYDGAPLAPDPGVLWRLAADTGMTVFGTSARYLAALEQSGARPIADVELPALRTILSTGSPLPPAGFDFVYESIGPDVQLASIAGGTDLISCFVLGNPMLPVYRGEIQCPGLGMDVRIVDDDGRPVVGEKGELVCGSPFPSMPVCFWNDPDGEAYRRAYFDRFPSLWHHGDYAELTPNGGVVMHGRSDATLNPGGVRIGTAEIYRVLDGLPGIADAVVIGQAYQGDTRIVLFVVPARGTTLDDDLRDRIRARLRRDASPRHVPAVIVEVTDIPRTLNGKTSERAVSDAVHGRPIANRSALANPAALDEFRNRRELDA